jgi:CSLREA domain-containing protein
MRSSFRLFVVVAGVLALAALLPAPAGIAGGPFQVTRFDDPLPGTCDPGDCSLREAVVAANSAAGSDVINLPAGTYSLSRPGASGATVGDLDIFDDLTINKTGNGEIALIDGNGSVTHDRVFQITNGNDLALNSISVTDGSASMDPNDNFLHGGGIRVDVGGGLTMTGGKVFDNEAGANVPNPPPYGDGAGFAINGTATLIRVVVEQNDAGFGFGGGMAVEEGGVATLIDSVVRNNDSIGFGAGISIGPDSTVNVNGGGIYGNTSENFGGGVYMGGGTLNLINATVSGNHATGGAGIRARNGAVFMNSATVADNTAEDAGGIALKDDAGAPATSLTMHNSIIAGNHDTFAPPRPDCLNENASATLTSQGHNIIGDATGCTFSAGAGDHIGSGGAPVNPLFFGLAFNGGRTVDVLTHAVGGTSPAVGGGDNCVSIDARGVPRPSSGCTIGAYERVLCHNTLVNRVGTAGNDTTKGSPSLKPTPQTDGILGLGGKDNLLGGKGSDAICGGAGNDTLGGGAGDDVLIGGPGQDVCKGATGTDTAISCETKFGIP